MNAVSSESNAARRGMVARSNSNGMIVTVNAGRLSTTSVPFRSIHVPAHRFDRDGPDAVLLRLLAVLLAVDQLELVQAREEEQEDQAEDDVRTRRFA